MLINQITEAEEPKDISARAKLNHSLRAQGHKVVPDKKKDFKKGKVKHKKANNIEEAQLVFHKESQLRDMLDTLLKAWKGQSHTPDEFKTLVNALGYDFKKDGDKATIVKKGAAPTNHGIDGELMNSMYEGSDPKADPKVVAKFADVPAKMRSYYIMKWAEEKGIDGDDAMFMAGYVQDGYLGAGAWNWRYVGLDGIDEGKGAIRGGLAAIALIASLWGVNNNMAQKAYDNSPQLQKLTAYLEVAKQHDDQRMIDQLEQRIGNHKMRLSLGKGDVMGKDGRAIDVVYDKDAQ